jgi:hypothetical protein
MTPPAIPYQGHRRRRGLEALPRFLLVPLLRIAIRADEKRVRGDEAAMSTSRRTYREHLFAGAYPSTRTAGIDT